MLCLSQLRYLQAANLEEIIVIFRPGLLLHLGRHRIVRFLKSAPFVDNGQLFDNVIVKSITIISEERS